MQIENFDNELHSLHIALDRSLSHTAYAVGPDGHYMAEVIAVRFRGAEWYVAHKLTPTGISSYSLSADRFCSHAGLVDWMKDQGFAKTRDGVHALLSKPIWQGDLVPADLMHDDVTPRRLQKRAAILNSKELDKVAG